MPVRNTAGVALNDPVSEEKVYTNEDESVTLATHADFFKECQDNRKLLMDIHVVIPVRPGDGMNCRLARTAAIWYGEGTGWAHLNDHMGGFIEVTRANILHDFRHNRKERFLLMIDNDMEPPLNLPYLLARHDKPVVAAPAMSVSSQHGPQLCFTVKDEDGDYRFPTLHGGGKIPAKGLVEVGHAGTGAMMIRRDVANAFTFKDGDIPFYVPEDVRLAGAATGHLHVGEDIAFCNALRNKGIPMYVDLEAHCGHRKTVSLQWDDEYKDPALAADKWVLPAGVGKKFGVG